MQFQTQIKILGAKFSKGQLDNGQHYDSTTLYIEVPLDASRGNACGICTDEFKWGTSDNFKLIQAQKLPLTVIGTLEVVSRAGKPQTQLIDIKLSDSKAG